MAWQRKGENRSSKPVPFVVNNMTVDGLAAQGARSLTIMLLTYSCRNIMSSSQNQKDKHIQTFESLKNGRHSTEDIFKYVLLNKNEFRIKFANKGPFDNKWSVPKGWKLSTQCVQTHDLK